MFKHAIVGSITVLCVLLVAGIGDPTTAAGDRELTLSEELASRGYGGGSDPDCLGFSPAVRCNGNVNCFKPDNVCLDPLGTWCIDEEVSEACQPTDWGLMDCTDDEDHTCHGKKAKAGTCNALKATCNTVGDLIDEDCGDVSGNATVSQCHDHF